MDPDKVVITLPDSCNVTVFAKSTGRARHIAVSSNGDVYVKLRSPAPESIIALRDENNDGVADKGEVFGDYDDEGEYGGPFLELGSNREIFKLFNKGLLNLNPPYIMW